MEEQAGLSAEASRPTELFDLPVSCLHHIVSFMDKQTKLQLFRTSKGSQDEPRCAVLVLRASKLHCTYTAQPQGISPRPAFSSLIHWASQISTDMELTVARDCYDDFHLLDALHSLLLYPDARATPSGRVLGKPATYPGITSLQLECYTCSSLIPDLVANAFPNLKSLSASWRPGPSQPLGSVLQRGLSSVQHVKVNIHFCTSENLVPAATQHIAQQLSHMPSLTSINVGSHVFQAVPAAVLAKLKRLELSAYDAPPAKDQAALKACSQLESLRLWNHHSDSWIQVLPQCVPSVRALDAAVHLGDEHMPPLLALPHLTSLGVVSISSLSHDFSDSPCSWQQIHCWYDCTTNITKLPLHALDSPVQCGSFRLKLSDYAADLAAIRAAKPHLLRCGGIRMKYGSLIIEIAAGSPITKEQAAEVLAEWAPCLSVPRCIKFNSASKPLFEDALARLWPEAEVLVVPG